MQPGGSGAVHFVHNAPPEDHDLKRQYLALLPPQQVIDICLTLDIHVPVALKRNIWPTDFKATIASMKNVVPKVEETPAVIPPMGSLNGTAEENKPPQPSSEPKPPDKQSTAGPSKPPATVVQPYGFATQPAYPHTPYYQALPPGFAPYPYPSYPPPPNGFPAAAYIPPQSFPSAYAQQHALFSAVQETTLPAAQSEDTDLPSYEDMIVEGLIAVDDPNGMAPKDLFNWMAARYPVQSNFRPSASQALQKAFRRGRFQKSSDGKYRLNPNWEGGNSSTRRATRRPQTQNAVPAAQKARAAAAAASAARSQPPQPILPPLPHHLAASASMPATARPTPAIETPKETPLASVPAPTPSVPPKGTAAFTAAQNILQTINFGGVFQLEDQARSAVKSEAVSLSLAEHARAELQAQLALLAAQLEEIAQQEEKEEDEDAEMEEVPVV
ncbi:H15 domain-containing protein [Mycena sanguinolenta]|uniref:Histone H1 n=1 Tax=Mycena sanguinolenta TaxID=230812 RepID=A0A8H7CQJ2_9AGAR|nr:H15 domain-containing protein [Mycena sanguinolenta]